MVKMRSTLVCGLMVAGLMGVGFASMAQPAATPTSPATPSEPVKTPDAPKQVPAEKIAKPAGSDEARKAAEEARKKREEAAPKVGDVAPDWELKDRDGNTVKLSELNKAGNIVLMDFWATWCGPCKVAMPHLQKLHETYKNDKVKILGLNTWERDDTKPNKEGKKLNAAEKATGYMDAQKFTYGLLMDATKVAEQYGVTGIPTFYVVGSDGKILFRGVGAGKKVEAELDKVLEDAVAKQRKEAEKKS